jgi:Asp-tRNA(Asn)/Glu-tRNA(Gln) amidotransferase B subunit
MNTLIKEVFVKTLKEKLNDIDVGNSEIEKEQALEILKLIAHEPVSKERAAIELGISPSRFDKLAEEKKLPKGNKKLGRKELRYYIDEIIEAGKKHKIGKFKK